MIPGFAVPTFLIGLLPRYGFPLGYALWAGRAVQQSQEGKLVHLIYLVCQERSKGGNPLFFQFAIELLITSAGA